VRRCVRGTVCRSFLCLPLFSLHLSDCQDWTRVLLCVWFPSASGVCKALCVVPSCVCLLCGERLTVKAKNAGTLTRQEPLVECTRPFVLCLPVFTYFVTRVWPSKLKTQARLHGWGCKETNTAGAASGLYKVLCFVPFCVCLLCGKRLTVKAKNAGTLTRLGLQEECTRPCVLCLTVLEISCLQQFDRQISQCRHAYAAGAASGVSEALCVVPCCAWNLIFATVWPSNFTMQACLCGRGCKWRIRGPVCCALLCLKSYVCNCLTVKFHNAGMLTRQGLQVACQRPLCFRPSKSSRCCRCLHWHCMWL